VVKKNLNHNIAPPPQGWNIGAILMTLLAYWLRHWSHLQLAFAVISLGLVAVYFLVKEPERACKNMQRSLTWDRYYAFKNISAKNLAQILPFFNNFVFFVVAETVQL
jgi:hypothetical protein